MEVPDLVAFLRAHELAIQASIDAARGPQAALVGFAVTDSGELVFDTLSSTRKCRNLRKDPRIALVIGWDDERTVQYEGVADEPTGDELARLKQVYFARFPDGRVREQWPGISYFRIRPRWARFSDFTGSAPRIEELNFA